MAKERDHKGRFAAGNAGGPGRPARPTEAEYLRALASSVTPADWQAITTKAIQAAKKGDSRARDWLSKYLLGGVSLAALAEHEGSGAPVLNTPQDALSLLSHAVTAVIGGQDLERARLLGSLASSAIKVFEVVDLAARLEAQQQQIDQLIRQLGDKPS